MVSPLALVLSGGSVRAAAHVGVLKALEEYNLRPNVLVGTSGGSIVAALYGAGMSARDLENLFISFKDRKDDIVDLNWLGLLEGITKKDPSSLAGLVKGDAIEKLINRELPKAKTFKDIASLKGKDKSISSIMIPAVNLNDGKQTIFTDLSFKLNQDGEYLGFRIKDEATISQAVRASISIPGVFVPAKLDDDYVDGGVRNGYPLSVAVKLAKATNIIGVNLGYAGMRRDDVAKRGPAEILGQSLDIMMRGQYKDFLNDEDLKKNKIITINPLIYDISTFELEYIPDMIERGYKVTKRMMSEKGLTQGGVPSRNRELLFRDISEPSEFPIKGSPYFKELLQNQLKQEKPHTIPDDSLAHTLASIINKLRLAGVFVVSTFLLSASGLLIWIIQQSDWVTGAALLGLVGASGVLVYRQGHRLVDNLLTKKA